MGIENYLPWRSKNVLDNEIHLNNLESRFKILLSLSKDLKHEGPIFLGYVNKLRSELVENLKYLKKLSDEELPKKIKEIYDKLNDLRVAIATFRDIVRDSLVSPSGKLRKNIEDVYDNTTYISKFCNHYRNGHNELKSKIAVLESLNQGKNKVLEYLKEWEIFYMNLEKMCKQIVKNPLIEYSFDVNGKDLLASEISARPHILSAKAFNIFLSHFKNKFLSHANTIVEELENFLKVLESGDINAFKEQFGVVVKNLEEFFKTFFSEDNKNNSGLFHLFSIFLTSFNTNLEQLWKDLRALKDHYKKMSILLSQKPEDMEGDVSSLVF